MNLPSIFHIACSYWRHHTLPLRQRQFHESPWQQKQIRKHLDYVWNRSAFYQKRVDWRRRHDLSAYPIINKKIMMENLGSINTEGLDSTELLDFALEGERAKQQQKLFRGKFTVGLSTGTSGARGLFIASPAERASWVGCLLSRVLPQPLFKYPRTALFLRANSSLYEETKRSGIQFQYYDLSLPTEVHLAKLQTFQPHTLLAPASVLLELSEKVRCGEVHLAPCKVIAIAEVLTLDVRRQIERGFQQRVHQIYQATEGFLAHTCAKGILRLNEDMQYIEREWVDQEQGLFTPIITDFRRRTQPVIRYRLDDVLQLQDSNSADPHPFTSLQAIIGRQNDVIYWPSTNSRQRQMVHPDLLCRIIAIYANGTPHYCFKQQSSILSLHINDLSGQQVVAVKNAIIALALHLNAQAPAFRIEPFEPLARGHKVRHIINLSKTSDGIS